MNTILSHYHICEPGPFGVGPSGLSGRITPKVAGSRRGLFIASKARWNLLIKRFSLFRIVTAIRWHQRNWSERFRNTARSGRRCAIGSSEYLRSQTFSTIITTKESQNKVKQSIDRSIILSLFVARLYKPEIECFDEPLTIRQTEEAAGSSGRSYTGFLKSLFSSNSTFNSSGMNVGAMAPSLSSVIPNDRLTDIDGKGIKGKNDCFSPSLTLDKWPMCSFPF
jgi:hypothetical protein